MTNGLRKHVEPQTEQGQQPETKPLEKTEENRDPVKMDREMTSKSK
jgi:hypothetical protein